MTPLTSAKVITPVIHRDNGHVEIEYLAEFDGQPIGFFATQAQAENEINLHVLLLCEHGLVDFPLALQAEQALVAANPQINKGHRDPFILSEIELSADPPGEPPTPTTEGEDIPTLPVMDGARVNWTS